MVDKADDVTHLLCMETRWHDRGETRVHDDDMDSSRSIGVHGGLNIACENV